MKKFTFIFVFLLFPIWLSAQEAEKVLITVSDGSEIIGTVIAETDSTTTVRTPAGMEMTMPNSIITNVEKFSGRVDRGKILMADPNKSMYLFSPSAFPIGDRHKYCRDFCLFFPSINYGVGNNLSFQGGIFWFPGLQLTDVPIVGSGKFTFMNEDRMALAAGVMYIRFPSFGDDEDNNMGSGFVFGTGTLGDGFNHFSVSLGYGFVQYKGDWEFMNRPILSLSGNKRVSNSLAIVTENWVLPEIGLENAILSLSARFFSRRIAVDLGSFFTLESMSDMGFIPVVNFTYHFE